MFVIDANIVIAALLKEGKTREIIVSERFSLISPDFLIEELDKHKDYIIGKAGISKEELEIVTALLLKRIRIVPYDEYKSRLSEAQEIMINDAKDVAYVACCLALNCEGIWTNDSDYEGKDEIKVFDTSHLLTLLQ